MSENAHSSPVLEAVEELVELVCNSQATTFQELQDTLDGFMKRYDGKDVESLALKSGCNIFRRFITRLSRDTLMQKDFNAVREELATRAKQFLESNRGANQKIAACTLPFLRDGSTVLVHGCCPTIVAVLAHAICKGRLRLDLLVTEARPTGAGYNFAQALHAAGGDAARDTNITIVADSAVAAEMPQVDLVLLGAEVIAENGGILNTVGSLQVAAVAKLTHKPVYVCAEKLKLAKTYPLNQSGLPSARAFSFVPPQGASAEGVSLSDRCIDYTPPQYITQINTDLGTMTPAAMSDEVLKLYT